MLEHLFGSKTRLKLLRTFFRDPSKSFYVRELTRLLDVQINGVRRELESLLKIGLVVETEAPADAKNSGKAGSSLRKYYTLDTGSILYPELLSLLMKAQALDEQEFIKTLTEKSGDVKLLMLTGRFSGEMDSPIDILFVGKVKERAIDKHITEYEKVNRCSLRYTIMSEQEFSDRRHMMDKFLFSVFEGKHVLVVDRIRR